MQPIAGGTVLVALEQQDASQSDVIFEESAADSSGNFNFCPLPTGATFDVVVVGVNAAGVAYNATVAVGVPGGTNLGAIPLVAEAGGPVTFQGFVTASAGSAAAAIDTSVSALQTFTLPGGAMLTATIPAEGNSTSDISVESISDCPVMAPPNSNCSQYTLIEPASNPSVGIFSAGKITYSTPVPGDVLYSIGASAFLPLSGGATDCVPPAKTTSMDTNGNPLKALSDTTVTPKEIDFAGCS